MNIWAEDNGSDNGSRLLNFRGKKEECFKSDSRFWSLIAAEFRFHIFFPDDTGTN